jgi:xanthine dehydrogenase accessory factor
MILWFNSHMPSLILIRGGGDLATGVAVRLLRCGLRVVIAELPQPLAVRRSVAFAEALYAGEITVEGITARRVVDPTDSLSILTVLGRQQVPVLADPECRAAKALHPSVIVDGRMTKRPPEPIGYVPQLYIGLGPGFTAGENCQAVVETRRGHTLGRVFWQGGPDPDTGHPDGDPARVLRAPADGILVAHVNIGDHVEEGQVIAEIDNGPQTTDHGPSSVVRSPFRGVLRGLLRPGLTVSRGLKIGDVDARDDPRLCRLVSDKSLAVGGGVLEAILSKAEVRKALWEA